MSAIKLHYLDLYGKAEQIRMLLAYHKLEFEDIRYSREYLRRRFTEGKRRAWLRVRTSPYA